MDIKYIKNNFQKFNLEKFSCEKHENAFSKKFKNKKCLECEREKFFQEAKNFPSISLAKKVGKAFFISEGEILTALEIKKGRTDRARARNEGSARYVSECPDHGETGFWVSVGLCAKCFTSNGTPRAGQRRDARRAQARRNKETVYDGVCNYHGIVDFGTRSGKCLQCYSAAGRMRRRTPQRGDSPRILARRAGKAYFDAVCDRHGYVEHYTLFGTCVACRAASNTTRRMPSLTMPEKALAAWARVDGVGMPDFLKK